MYGQYGNKPLHLPEPRHRDRRAGVATDDFRRALSRPSEMSAIPIRSPEERRASYRRLAARSHTARTWASRRFGDVAPLVIVILVIAVVLGALT